MNISLFSAIALYLNSAVAFFIVKGKAGRNLSFVLFSMASFSFFVYIEYHTQTVALKEIFGIEKLKLVKLFSALAGFFVMFALFRFLIFSIEFPPRTNLTGSFLIFLHIPALIICSTSYFGLIIKEQGERFIRESTGFMYLHVIFYFATGLTGTFLLFSKSIQHSSLLRKFQITYIPLGLIVALVIGGIFGYVFYDNPVMVSVASFAPLFFSFVMLAGFLFSREIFSMNFNQKEIINRTTKIKKVKDLLRLLLKDNNINLTIRIKKEGNQFDDFLLSEISSPIPDPIFEISRKEMKYFFIEDYDENPDSPEFQFCQKENIQAGCFYDFNPGIILILIHNFNNTIISKPHFLFLTELFASLNQEVKSELLFPTKGIAIKRGSLFSFLQREFDLTFTEARICAEISVGTPREKVQQILNIEPTTLKTHLASIYSKTIEKLPGKKTFHRDKLQRLTVFLNRVMKDAQ